MKQVNPLLLLLLIVSLLIFSIIFVGHERKKETIILKELQANQQMAKQIVNYKKIWENKKLYDKTLNHFYKSLNNKHIVFTKKSFSNYIEMIFPHLNRSNTTYLLSTLLNQNFKIKSLQIKRVDESKLKVSIEVAR